MYNHHLKIELKIVLNEPVHIKPYKLQAAVVMRQLLF